MSIRYSDDFKKEVVKAYMAGDKSTVQIAADYNIAKSTISHGLISIRKNAFIPPTLRLNLMKQGRLED